MLLRARRVQGIVYLSSEIALYESEGAVIENLNITNVLAGGLPTVTTYLPGTNQFAIGVSTEPTKLRIINRAGVFVRDIDFAPIGLGCVHPVAYADPEQSGAGQFLVFDYFSTCAFVTDPYGNLLAEFDYRAELGLSEVSGACAITTGRQAGAFAVVDENNNKLVTFRLVECRR